MIYASGNAAGSTASSLCSSELAAQALTAALPGSQLASLTPNQKDDRQAVQQAAPRVPGRIRDIHLKLLLAGESGLGKTTLAYQLLRSYSKGGAAITKGHDGSTSSMEQFKSSPESFCTDLAPIMIEDQHLKLHIKIQDMPGWGDDINLRRYLETVMNFIMKQRAADYQERGGNRSFPKEYVSGSLTHGVTACLYFLPPQRVKPVDIIFMSALSQQVVLIPVVAKADTMTVEETARYRQDILQRCLDPNSHITSFGGQGSMPDLKMNIFSFDGEDLAALDVITAVPPFTLIASEQFDEKTGEPMRRHLWGDCNAADRNHSDLILLKRLLFGDKVNSLWQLLDDAYDRYASFCEAYEAAGHKLPQLVADACAACGPHLEYDDHLKSQTEVQQLQADKQDSVGLAAAAALNGSTLGRARRTSVEPVTVILTGNNATAPNVSGASGAPLSSSALLADISRGLRTSKALGFAASLGLDVKRHNYDLAMAGLHADVRITVIDYNNIRTMVHDNITNVSLQQFLNRPRPEWSKVRWINVQGLSWDVIQTLAKQFDLHPLSVEDIVHIPQRIKADYYQDYLYTSAILVSVDHPSQLEELPHLALPEAAIPAGSGSGTGRELQLLPGASYPSYRTTSGGGSKKAVAQAADAKRTLLQPMELVVEQASFFLFNDGTLISLFTDEGEGIARSIVNKLKGFKTLLTDSEDASFLFNALLDAVVDHTLPVVQIYASHIAALEAQVMLDKRPQASLTKELHLLSNDLKVLRRTLVPTRNLIHKLRSTSTDTSNKSSSTDTSNKSGSQSFLSPLTVLYMSDVLDHISSVVEDMDVLAEDARDLIDLIFNTISHQNNASMQMLAVVSTIFLPITFIAGVYGTNFDQYFPEIHWQSYLLYQCLKTE
eukprot:gene2620-2921_t